MTYELVIKESQPTCGGKSPTRTTIQTVDTDDPVAYVKAHEPGSALEIAEADGTLTVTAARNGMPVIYEFTED